MAFINWTLVKGAHDWPGPDGGTCVNEAAIIAAGMEYRPVQTVEDCPYSPVIAAFAMRLNELMPYDLRQELLSPFIPRLAGTADTPERERAKLEYIALEITRRILAELCVTIGRSDLAAACRRVATLEACDEVTDQVGFTCGFAGFLGRAALAAQQAAFDVVRFHGPQETADWAGDVIRAALASRRQWPRAWRAALRRKFLVMAVEILDGAIRLGRHAEPDIAVAVARLERAKPRRFAA